MLNDWVAERELPVGIGIDLVTVSELKALDERVKGAFVQRTFTENEQNEAQSRPEPWVYLAGRYAVKEAVFKSLAPLTPEKTFDFRIVETLTGPDGSPNIICDGLLREIMNKANTDRLLVSISNEGDYAIALAQAVQMK